MLRAGLRCRSGRFGSTCAGYAFVMEPVDEVTYEVVASRPRSRRTNAGAVAVLVVALVAAAVAVVVRRRAGGSSVIEPEAIIPIES